VSHALPYNRFCSTTAKSKRGATSRKAVDRNADNRIEFLDKLDKSELQGTLKREVGRLVALRRPEADPK
jgi:hypothetical protein